MAKNRLTIRNINSFEKLDFGEYKCDVVITQNVYTFTFTYHPKQFKVVVDLERYPNHWDPELRKHMYRYHENCYVSAEWFTIDRAYKLFKPLINGGKKPNI